MIAFRAFALRRGGRLLLESVDAVLHDGWKVGVAGRNGSGKSSLFAAIMGGVEADAGALDVPAGVRIASVAQETPALPDAAIDYVLGGDAELAAALADEARAQARGDHAAAAAAHHRIDALDGYDGRARAGRLLHGLGFRPDDHEKAVAEFSGGWRGRLNLARALMAPSDLLLLDEPTNHLDLDAVLWLEQWLRRYPRMLMVISHDREFLDGTVDHILHLEQGHARLYAGNYSDFERQRAERLHQQQAAFAKEQAERAHLQSFIDRFRAKATKARQAQSRIKRLERLAGTEAVRVERAFSFAFPEPGRLPQSMLKLEHVDAGYPPPRGTVLADVRFGVQAGDRVGLLGPNGAGKSTLVKTLVGELPLLAGERGAHKDLVIGYFAQHTVESLRAGDTPFDHLREVAPEAPVQALRDWLGQWHFAGDRAFESVDGFSGGERARLALALIAWRKPNLLVLDEPTNHLDLDMREALADALNDYPGALVLVAHDRHLLGLACDTFWRVADGRVEAFDGDLDDYARWLRSRGGEADAPEAFAAKPAADPRERRRGAAAERERTRGLRKRIEKIEARTAAIEKELAALQERLADPAIYTGPTAVLADIGREQNALREEKSALESEWLQRFEELEAASA
ncbi:MAG: ATP-binding cassette domain-containing protein [Xanthomonadales bacterium]|nr:ATP-binding cassette domain-containing protein [Xanthomonadales bacterium]ODU92880.1 MAG: ABC transporter ATP-binding protein [Rhodanobacter sp. SCN 66-43]OJY83670.1 MAG: ABC transporter ATP-binding protein [Xanthomonadales bacterium 66-474]